MSASVSALVSELDELVWHLSESQNATGRAFGAEMVFFAQVADLVTRREAERASRGGKGTVTHSTQLGMREIFAEIGAELRLSEWQVARKVSLAATLTNVFGETLADASGGEITPAHATLIADAGIAIADAEVCAEFEAVARDMAREMTPAQLKAALSGLVVRLDPEGTEQRVRDAVKGRKVTVRELEPGLSRLTVDGPTAQVVGAYNRARDIAEDLSAQNADEKADWETAQSGGVPAASAPSTTSVTDEAAAPEFDERTVPQLMADVLCDLMLTSAVDGHGATDQARERLSAIRPTVHVTVPVTMLARTTVGGATVDGFGPIDDDTARQLAASAPEWVRVATDPATGVPTCVDRYRPSARQELFLRVRDEQCRFPGCRRPARKCDTDHTIAHSEGGPTCLCNLAHLCERHHTVKHDTDWFVEQLPGGILRWTAPTGRTHVSRPPGTVRFTPIELIDPDPHLTHVLTQQYARDPAPF